MLPGPPDSRLATSTGRAATGLQVANSPGPSSGDILLGFTIRFGVLQEFYPSSFISNAVTLHFTGVNNKGQIVGGFTDENRSHGFIATPQT